MTGGSRAWDGTGPLGGVHVEVSPPTRRSLPIALFCAPALTALEAGASTMQVRYSLQPFVELLGEIRSGPGTGTLDLVYASSSMVPASSTGSGFSALPGPVALLGASLQATAFLPHPTLGGPRGVEVKLHLTLQPAMGSLLPGGTLFLPMIPGVASRTLHCIISCFPYLSLAASVPQPSDFPPLNFA